MEHFDSGVIDVNERQVIHSLKDEMTRVIQDIAAFVSPNSIQEHLESYAVMEIFAWVQFETEIDAYRVKRVEDRHPPFCQFIKGGLTQTGRTLCPRIDM